MRTLAVIAFIFIIVPLLLLAARQFGLLKGPPPSEPGLREGKLKPPSRTQNSVSSQASLWPEADYAVEYAAIEPLAFTQDSALAMNRLRDVLAGDTGRVLEVVRYTVDPANREAFLAAMREARRVLLHSAARP